MNRLLDIILENNLDIKDGYISQGTMWALLMACKNEPTLLGHVEFFKNYLNIHDDDRGLFFEKKITHKLYANFESVEFNSGDYKIHSLPDGTHCYLSYEEFLLGVAYSKNDDGVIQRINPKFISFSFLLRGMELDKNKWFVDESRSVINGWIPIFKYKLETPVIIILSRIFGKDYYYKELNKLKLYFKNMDRIPIHLRFIQTYIESC